MFSASRGIVCLICNRSVLRRRRYTITSVLFQRNPTVARFISNNIGSYHIAFNNEEYICRPCYQRAVASSTSASSAPEQGDAQIQDAPVPPDQDDAQIQDAPVPPDQDDAQIQDAPVAPPQGDTPAPQQEDAPVLGAHDMDNVNIIMLPDISRPPNSARSCMVPGCQRLSLHVIPKKQKIHLMQVYNYYIPEFARICNIHLQSNDWEAMSTAPNVMHTFNAVQVTDIINMMKKAAEDATRFDFENIQQFDDDQLYYFTGRTREQFLRIVEQIPSFSETCSQPNTALGIMLMKLRTGEPNERLSLLFKMSRRTLERLMKSAREALTRDFVPAHLGWDNITREQIAHRNLQIPNALFGNGDATIENLKAIVICDGTYIYIYKSSNFLFQVDTYSPHKYNNLLKPLMFVCSDGYIIEVTGPHGAKKSDASIMQDIIDNEEHPFHVQFSSGDVFVLDRGFRDVVSDLEALGYEVFMPHTVNRGETQLTTSQANDTRKVTLIRWVVEVVNGRIKRDFKLFRQEYFHSAMPHMFEDFRIAAALTNCFHVPITDSEYAVEIIQRINERQDMQNILGEFVTRHHMNRQRIPFQEMNADLPELETFPRLTESDLILFALGTYQLKIANSYYSEHVRNDGHFKISLYRDQAQLITELNEAGINGTNIWLLRARIQSRYTRTKIYYSYIVIDDDEIGLNAFNHYYCSCKAGNRTLGCCAHVMVIMWYLSMARYGPIHRPALFMDSIIIDQV